MKKKPRRLQAKFIRWENDQKVSALLLWMETDADPGYWPPPEKWGLAKGQDFVFSVWKSPTTGREKSKERPAGAGLFWKPTRSPMPRR